jgi:hypothetical protein
MPSHRPQDVPRRASCDFGCQCAVGEHGLPHPVLIEPAEIDEPKTEPNLRNKISRGGFSAAFFVQTLVAIGARTVRLHEAD